MSGRGAGEWAEGTTFGDRALGGTLLDYKVTPVSVPASRVDKTALSIVTICVTATNNGANPAPVTAIDITIPYGDWIAADALVQETDVGAIAAMPADDPPTPWAIMGGDDNTWHAVVLPPATSVAPGAVIGFVFDNVIVNGQPDDTAIGIDEWSGTSPVPGSAPITKSNAPPAPQTAPSVASFTADGTPDAIGVALGSTITFAWTTANADSCYLTPGPVQLLPAAGGALPLSIHQSDVYEIQAYGAGGTASKPLDVTVMPVAITSFTANPAIAGPGDTVTLTWATQYASACSIDEGVGPVGLSGQTTVTAPDETTVYTLAAQGLDPQFQQTKLTVQQQ